MCVCFGTWYQSLLLPAPTWVAIWHISCLVIISVKEREREKENGRPLSTRECNNKSKPDQDDQDNGQLASCTAQVLHSILSTEHGISLRHATVLARERGPREGKCLKIVAAFVVTCMVLFCCWSKCWQEEKEVALTICVHSLPLDWTDELCLQVQTEATCPRIVSVCWNNLAL